MSTTVKNYVWVVTECYDGDIFIAQNAAAAYDLCREFINSLTPFCSSLEIKSQLEELRTDFLENGNDSVGSFGVEEVIWARRQEVWGN